MPNSPASYHRSLQDLPHRLQEGTILSWTAVRHPPKGFPDGARQIAVIQLTDGTRVMGQLTSDEGISIGQTVRPRMRLSQVTEQGLRMYDAVYEPVNRKPAEQKAPEFEGYIVALTGPSGVGKSTISALLAGVATEYVERVPIITTRQKKNGEEGEYIHTTAAKFRELQNRGEIIAATDIPSSSEERMYGYRASDIQAIRDAGKVPLVITEQQLLQELADHYGRRSILSFGLLPPGQSRRAMLSQLLHRLRSRGRDTEESIQDRIKNAEKDLDFFEQRKELFDHLLVNEHLDTVIDALKGHVLQRSRAS